MKRRGLQIGKFYRTRNEDSSDPSIRSSKRLNPSPNSNTNPSPEIFLGNQPRTNISTSYQKNDDIVNHSSPKQISPKMGVSNGGSVSKSNIHVDGNSDHNFLSPEMRKRQLGRLHSLMVRLSAGGAKQFETMNGTSSILSELFEEANILLNEENMNQERFFVEEEQNKGKNVDMDMDMGLNEDEIMTCIKHETFESTKEECLENKEACSMCQVIYMNGEKLGRLYCLHKFHMECIKYWLSKKNKCPVCKRRALIANDDDDNVNNATDLDDDDGDSVTDLDDGYDCDNNDDTDSDIEDE